jgi:hypothetical protein
MSYNGSGTFVINTAGQPVVTGTSISSSVFNALTADLATGLSTAITKDGQTATTARIPFVFGINSSLTTDSTSGTTGSIFTAGGIGVAKSVVVAGATDASSTTTGAIITAGGVGVAKALYAGGDSYFTSTGALQISKGTTAERPTGVTGKLRFNTTTGEFEGYTGAAWASVGGSAIVNDTSTATNIYPLMASATSGTAATVNTSNAKLLYKPSTGEFQSTVLVASNGIVVNSATIATNYTIATGNNAMSAGPVTINTSITVTVSSGSRWAVV